MTVKRFIDIFKTLGMDIFADYVLTVYDVETGTYVPLAHAMLDGHTIQLRKKEGEK